MAQRVFLAVFVLWLAALVCALRAEASNARARITTPPIARLLVARAGMQLLALVLIFGSDATRTARSTPVLLPQVRTTKPDPRPDDYGSQPRMRHGTECAAC